MTYTPLDTWCDEKNEPNTNPKRTQFKPISDQTNPKYRKEKNQTKKEQKKCEQ